MPADTVDPVRTAENGRAFSRTHGQIQIVAYLHPKEVAMFAFPEFGSPVGAPSTMRTRSTSTSS